MTDAFPDSTDVQYATTDASKIAYKLRGAGPRVLLIQGVGVHGDGWLPQTRVLARSFQCVTFDNRGIGASTPVDSSLRVESMVQDALAVMQHIGWDDAHVVGHSLGGLIAQAIASRHPDRVRSLSLLCTFCNGAAVAPVTPRMIWWGMRATIGTMAMRRHGFLGLLFPPNALELANSNEVAERLVDVFGHDLAIQPPMVRYQLKAMRACNLTNELKSIRAKTLVVSGKHDVIAPTMLGSEIANRIPGAQYMEFANAAHGLPISNADDVNPLIERHIRECEDSLM